MSDTKLLFFRLPNSLFVQILSQWLDIHDVGVLDTTMTNKKHRPEFLQCLKEMRNPTVPVSFSTNMVKWISERQIHVETLNLDVVKNSGIFNIHSIMESLHLPSLRKLTIGNCECPPWLRHIPQFSPLLEELTVRIISGTVMEDLLFVCSQCLELKNVSIDFLSFRSHDWTDDLLSESLYGDLVVEIRIVNGYQRRVTTKCFKNYIRGCRRLRKLGYSYFDDNGKLLKCIAQSCPLLEDIRFDTCSKPALEELSRNCKQLRKVEVCKSDVDNFAEVSEIEVLKQIDTLEELSLIDCGLTNEKLAVISGFRHLKRLHLVEYYGVDGLTGAGFRVLEGSPISETLQSVTVGLWESGEEGLPLQNFDIAGMVAGIASCHNLRNIDLMYQCLCDDAGLLLLGAGCPLLEEIKLTYGPVTVDGLVDLAEHCQHLTKVVLWYNPNEGIDLETEIATNFDSYHVRAYHARARALPNIKIVRSRLPHIEFVCESGWDECDM